VPKTKPPKPRSIRIGRISPFTPEQEKFLLEQNVARRTYSELAEFINKHFKTDFTRVQIRNFYYRKGIKNGLPRNKDGHYWTKDELSFLAKQAEEKTDRELTFLLNNAFNLSLTVQQVRAACFYHKIKRAKVPPKCTEEIKTFILENSNQKASSLTRMVNAEFGTSFDARQVAAYLNYYRYKPVKYKNTAHELPINTERIKRGRIFVKVSMDGPIKWREKHLLIWEQANGKIPERNCIIFLDRNRLNCSLENLAMVNSAEMIMLTRNGLYLTDREATLAGIAAVKYILAIHGRLEETLGHEEHRRFIGREFAKRKREQLRRLQNIKEGTATV
jgi:hypothetical protein